MNAWGVRANLLNVKAKLERDENLAFMIPTIRAKYAKALKST
jgi:hypothetical protein